MCPLIIDMQEFTCVGWVWGLYACTVKCHLCTSKVRVCTVTAFVNLHMYTVLSSQYCNCTSYSVLIKCFVHVQL